MQLIKALQTLRFCLNGGGMEKVMKIQIVAVAVLEYQ